MKRLVYANTENSIDKKLIKDALIAVTDAAVNAFESKSRFNTAISVKLHRMSIENSHLHDNYAVQVAFSIIGDDITLKKQRYIYDRQVDVDPGQYIIDLYSDSYDVDVDMFMTDSNIYRFSELLGNLVTSNQMLRNNEVNQRNAAQAVAELNNIYNIEFTAAAHGISTVTLEFKSYNNKPITRDGWSKYYDGLPFDSSMDTTLFLNNLDTTSRVLNVDESKDLMKPKYEEAELRWEHYCSVANTAHEFVAKVTSLIDNAYQPYPSMEKPQLTFTIDHNDITIWVNEENRMKITNSEGKLVKSPKAVFSYVMKRVDFDYYSQHYTRHYPERETFDLSDE